jgi:ATP-dependent Clp protease protease subunit
MVKNFYGRILFIVILLVMCGGVKAVQSQEKEIVDEYLEYAANWTNFNESTIVDIITSMSFGGVQYGKDSINSMLSNRNIILNAAVDDYTAAVVTSMLSFYDAKSGEDILFYINSPGGSVYAGLGIYDIMQLINSDVRTVCTGMAASMAAVLLSSGTKGKRASVKGGKIMIHNPQTDKEESDKNAAEVQKVRTEILGILVNNTGQPERKIAENLDSETWFGAEDAKEYNMIDYIIK